MEIKKQNTAGERQSYLQARRLRPVTETPNKAGVRKNTLGRYLYTEFKKQWEELDSRAALFYVPGTNVERDGLLHDIGRLTTARHEYLNRLWRAFEHGFTLGREHGRKEGFEIRKKRNQRPEG